jgi:hypothetical protein
MYKIEDFERIVDEVLKKHQAYEPDIETMAYDNEYKIMVAWFKRHEEKWTSDIVRFAGLAIYGWMPTILRAEGRKNAKRDVDFLQIANHLNSGEFPVSQYAFLNGSVVGTSKFLHFWRPNEFAIWDKNIRISLKVSPHSKSLTSYCDYLHDMRKYCGSRELTLRDVEFPLFINGRNLKSDQYFAANGSILV